MTDTAASSSAALPASTAPRMLGTSAPMQRVHTWLRRAARHQAPVLLYGETGTGKDVAAQLLVSYSARAQAPLVTVNCGALAPQLIASELFGHERGAFTGAVAAKAGAFTTAHGGSLFLDEIGELPLELQPQLLRALETGDVRRVGAVHSRQVDVRIVAATNRNLAAEVEAGRFRADLFHRLHVLVLELPPLRERCGDLPQLVHHFCSKYGHPHVTFSDAAWVKLHDHLWPGNVRELKNVLQRALLLRAADRIDAEDINFAPAPRSFTDKPRTLAELERDAIIAELSRHNGNRTAAAVALGCSRSTMYRRLQEFGLL